MGIRGTAKKDKHQVLDTHALPKEKKKKKKKQRHICIYFSILSIKTFSAKER